MTTANGHQSSSNCSKKSYSRVLFDQENVSSELCHQQRSLSRLSGSKQKCESTGSIPLLSCSWQPARSLLYGRHSTSSIPNLSPVETLDKHGRKRYSTISGAWPMPDDERVKQAVRLVLLLLPPANRRKLHLLLRFLNKVKANTELQLADNPDALQTLLIDTFYQAIICSPDSSDMDINLAKHLVLYLIENHDIVMQVPSDLRSQVEDRLSQLQRVQVVYTSDDKGATTYCKQVPVAVYEKEAIRHSTDALGDLLKSIVADEKMNQKEKTKKLREFQRLYPQIYEKEFGSESGPIQPSQRKPSRNVHLPRPLRRLRTLRA
ncbi:unnamed protein product [Acanthosepion pharaonis]|uniref:DEP domain-containing protein n=1 Tax=Acanthosepion pharaonis TaxID=158019 RepID=A0A812DGM6_ACAPH|nr:unnamed protein product [Sepia pharaonis]